jgi:hypothetical protein
MAKKNGNGNGKGTMKKAEVKYKEIVPGQFSDENIVVVHSSGGPITMILPSFFVNTSNKTIKAAIIEEKSDNYLMVLPNDTFTTGSTVWFPKSEILVPGLA